MYYMILNFKLAIYQSEFIILMLSVTFAIFSTCTQIMFSLYAF